MWREIILFTGFFTLMGCNGGCISPIRAVSCGGPYGETWPSIAYIQKPETIGHTNSEQRWRDAVACGAEYGDVELRSVMHKSEAFDVCMTQKGYIDIFSIDSLYCGSQDPKEDTGKCNL